MRLLGRISLFTLLISILLLIGCATADGLSKNNIQKASNNKIEISETFTVPRMFLTENENEWNRLSKNILSSNKKIIYLELRGFGGYTTYLDDFLYSLDKAKKQGKVIIGIISGETVSAHAILSCYMDRLIITNRGSLLFHSVGVYDQEGNFIKYIDTKSEMEKQNKYYLQCRDKKLLDDSDIFSIEYLHQAVVVEQGTSYTQEDVR